jgi:hypothetical protein
MAHHLGAPPGIDPGLGVKRVFMERFPYSVYFIELPTRIRILAFAHAIFWKSTSTSGQRRCRRSWNARSDPKPRTPS